MTIEEIAEQFLELHRRNERPDVEEFVAQFPELADEIRATLPALAIVEEFGLDSENSAPSRPLWPEPLFSQIGDYQIIAEIGRGGMGIVYEAEQRSLRRRVALKVLPQLVGDDNGLVRFRREAQAAARLHHTNIVPVYDVGQDGDNAYYAMQLIRGQGLDAVITDLKRLRHQPPPELHEPAGHPSNRSSIPTESAAGTDEDSPSLARSIISGRFRDDDFSESPSSRHVGDTENESSSRRTADKGATAGKSAVLPGFADGSAGDTASRQFYRSVAQIGLQTADALAYAHARGIVHRDIKPSNLLLDATGVVWVTDFGLAKTEDAELTKTGDILGTLRYMSPERFQRQCDERTDLYALGVTLWELLVMKPAYSTIDRLQLVRSIMNDALPAPRKCDPRVPLDLETIVLKAIEKDPRDRYQSAVAMADDLRRFINDEPIMARRLRPFERLLRWSRLNKGFAAALSAAAVLLIMVVGISTWTSFRQAELRRVAEEGRDHLQKNLYFSQMNVAGQAAAHRYGTHTMRARLAEWHPQIVGQELRNWEWYYLYALSHRETFVSEPLGNDFCWACDHSPDGTRIVNTVNAWGVQVRDAVDGTVLVDRCLGSARFVDWSPDGKKIAVGCFLGRCVVLDAETLETIRELAIPAAYETYSVKWHSNSRWLAEASDGGDREKTKEIRIHDAQTGEVVRTLKGHQKKVWALSWHPDGTRIASTDGTQIRVWNLADGQTSFESEGGGAIWSPDGSMLACIRESGIWDVISETRIAALEGPSSFCWAPTSQQLAISCPDGTIRIYDVKTASIRRVLLGHDSDIWSVSWSSDGRFLASCGLRDETVRTWNVSELDDNQSLVGDRADHALELAHDGSRIAASASYSGTIYVWDLSGQLRANRSFSSYVEALAVSPDGARVAHISSTPGSAVWDPGITIWDTVGDTVVELPTDDSILDLAWHDDGRLAGAESSGDIRIWDVSGNPILKISGAHDGGVWQIDWNPDGSQLASSGADKSVKVWNVNTGQLLRRWESTLDISDELRFSHDGSRLAAASRSMIVQWDVANGRRLAQFDEIRERYRTIDWSPDDSRIVAGSDSSITLWDVESGRLALKLDDTKGLRTVRWSPDGMHIVAGGRRFVTIYDASRGYALNPPE